MAGTLPFGLIARNSGLCCSPLLGRADLSPRERERSLRGLGSDDSRSGSCEFLSDVDWPCIPLGSVRADILDQAGLVAWVCYDRSDATIAYGSGGAIVEFVLHLYEAPCRF